MLVASKEIEPQPYNHKEPISNHLEELGNGLLPRASRKEHSADTMISAW
jgi:hypothetical protein